MQLSWPGLWCTQECASWRWLISIGQSLRWKTRKNRNPSKRLRKNCVCIIRYLFRFDWSGPEVWALKDFTLLIKVTCWTHFWYCSQNIYLKQSVEYDSGLLDYLILSQDLKSIVLWHCTDESVNFCCSWLQYVSLIVCNGFFNFQEKISMLVLEAPFYTGCYNRAY